MSKLDIRPSGSAVLLNTAVKVFPNEEEAAAVVARHESLDGLALPVLHSEGCVVVFPMASPVNELSSDNFRNLLDEIHNTETGAVSTPLRDYVRYSTRSEELPKIFRQTLLDYYAELSSAKPNVKTVHGDANVTNIVMLNGAYRWIDLSIRPEPLYKEIDEAKYFFNEIRCGRNQPFKTSLMHRMFLASHFCRVWTRECQEERLKLEQLHGKFFRT